MTDSVVLPVAGVEIIFYFPFMIGIAGGFISSVFGVGSGLIITPCLMMMGIPPMVSVSSQLNNAASTGFVSFLAYFKKRDVDIALGMYLFFGGLCGAILEFFFLDHFRDRIKIFAVIFLSFLAVIMLIQNLASQNSYQSNKPSGLTMRHWMIYIPFHRIFIRSRVEMSILVPFFIGIITGLLTSSLGGATSVFTIPMLTYIIGRISAAVTGTSFLAGFGINTVIIILHSLNGAPCDFILVFLLISGGIIGVMLGVFFLNYLPKNYVGILGSLLIMGVCVKFWIDVLSQKHIVEDTSSLMICDWLKPFMDHYTFEYSIICLIIFIVFSWVMQGILSKITELIRKNPYN